MKPFLRLAVAASLALSAAAAGQSHVPAAVYHAGSQYTATLEQSHNRWRLQPLDGQDVEVDIGRCATGAMVPAGVWLLVLDDAGRPSLVAPSVTRLPAGSAGRIALRACDKATGRELAVPQTLLDLLTRNTGAIYVKD